MYLYVNSIEKIQHRAARYVVNDYNPNTIPVSLPVKNPHSSSVINPVFHWYQ